MTPIVVEYAVNQCRGFLHRPAGPVGDALVLTHGAGSNCHAPLLVAVAEAFSAQGWLVLRIDLSFRRLRPQGPPPRGSAEQDQQGLRAAVAAMRQEAAGRVFLGGHSYGGRQASMLAAEEADLTDGLLLLSYPLHPPQKPDAMRTAHFPRLQVPALFVHGSKDGFGSLDEMVAALPLIPARTALLPVTGAGHELLSKRNQGELPGTVVSRFCSFMNSSGVSTRT
jgi:predicted alpha/beta-hydrolase family hydrolase